MRKRWIGVDLDRTLAEYKGWVSPTHIGEPIPKMVSRVKSWLAEGKDVRIFTSRISGYNIDAPESNKEQNTAEVKEAIENWCLQHIGCILPITNVKDAEMIELWDDIARQIIPNTGDVVVSCVGDTEKHCSTCKNAVDLRKGHIKDIHVECITCDAFSNWEPELLN